MHLLIKNFFPLLAILFCLTAAAQKVDLDGEPLTANFTRLPRKPFPADYLTYSAVLSANPQDLKSVGLAEPFFISNLQVFGFQKVNTGGNFNIDLSLSDYRQTGSETKTATTKTKDRAGKEIETKTYYYEVKYEHGLTLKVRNQDGKQLEERSLLGGEHTFKSREFSTVGEVNNYIRAALGQDLAKEDQNAIVGAMRDIYDHLNSQYGYTPTKTTFKLQILDSEKHPDYAGFQQAYKGAKVAMNSMKPDVALDSVKLALKPVMEYFSQQKDKYNPAEKGDKKLKYACLYNLSLLYFWTEDFEKATEFANALIANDYDPKDGKRLIEDIEELQKEFEKTGKTSRHLKFEAPVEVSPTTPPVAYKSDSDERKVDYKVKSLDLTPNTMQYEGWVTGTDGKETKVLFLVENPRMTGLLFSSVGNVRYAIDLGERFKVNRINKANTTAFGFDGRTFKVLPFKSANSVNIGGGKTILEVLEEGSKIGAFLAFAGDNEGLTNPPEYVIQKIADQEYVSLNGLKFALNLNKGVKKTFSDCPAAVEAADKDGFKRTSESIVQLAKLLQACSK
jgi:hypothetical protein